MKTSYQMITRAMFRAIWNQNLLALGLALVAGASNAATPLTNYWMGGSGLWSDKAHWSLGYLPNTNVAAITADGTYTVTMDGFGTTNYVVVGGITGTQTLDTVSWTLPYVTVGSHGVVNVGALGINVALTNQGRVIYKGSAGGSGTAWVENMAGGILDIQGDGSWGNITRINNAGVFRRSSRTSTIIMSPSQGFNNTGTIEVLAGSLNLRKGLTSSGTISVADGSSIILGVGTDTFSPGHVFQGTGVCRFTEDATVIGDLNGTFEIAANVNFDAWLASGTMSWMDHLKTSSGNLTVGPGAMFKLTDAGHLAGTITNYGTIQWPNTGSTAWWFQANGRLENEPGGLVEVQGDKTFAPDESGPAIHNAGTWRKSGGVGPSVFQSRMSYSIAFANEGVVEAQLGTISFQGPYTETAAATLGVSLAGTTLGSGYGHISFAAAPTFAGTFAVTLANGFTPAQGNSFNVVSYPSASGSFSAWQGLNTGGGLRLFPQTSPTNTSLVALPSATLSTAISGGGRVVADPAGPYYPVGTVVKLYALPLEGWAFSAWSGAASSAANPLTVTMDADKSITATFISTVPDIIVDNPAATFTGTWTVGTGSSCYGSNYRYTVADSGGDTAKYDFDIQHHRAGNYALYAWFTKNSGNIDGAIYELRYSVFSRFEEIQKTYQVDQAGFMGSAGGKWVRLDEPLSLGRYLLLPPAYARLTISNGVTQASHNLIADAVKLSWSTNQSTLIPFIRSVIRPDSTHCVVTWIGETGAAYSVQAKTNLTDAAWTDLSGSITAASTTQSWTDATVGVSRRFYRIVCGN